MNCPKELLYTKMHEWVRKTNDKNFVVGITDYAQSNLGELVFVELPEKDESIHAMDEVCVVESVKSASDVYAPLSGKITKVNSDLLEAPSLVNKNPYDDGWLYEVAASDESELKDLMSADDYENYLKDLEEA